MLAEPVAPEAPRPSDGSGPIDIGGGRRLFARWAGLGGGWDKRVPVIVLEAGLTDTHRSWDPVFERIADFAPVLAYDRAGRGQSEPRPHPELAWTGADIADDQIRLVRALKVERRVVVVGHSFGGLVARLAAERYPVMVVGLVLVDASHEDAHDSYLEILRGDARAEYARRIAVNPEGIDFPATCAQTRSARFLRGRPLTVIARGRLGDAPPGWPPEHELMEMWRGLQNRLASLSPSSRLVIAERSGHYVHRDEPELVIDAVRRTAEEAARWAPREPGGMRVRCLVPDPTSPPPTGPRVLLLPRTGEPAWQVPTFERPKRAWIAANVNHLAREVEKLLGGRFSVLRHLHEEETEALEQQHIAVLEVQDASWTSRTAHAGQRRTSCARSASTRWRAVRPARGRLRAGWTSKPAGSTYLPSDPHGSVLGGSLRAPPGRTPSCPDSA